METQVGRREGRLQVKRAGCRATHVMECPGRSLGAGTGDVPFVCQQGLHSRVTGTERENRTVSEMAGLSPGFSFFFFLKF